MSDSVAKMGGHPGSPEKLTKADNHPDLPVTKHVNAHRQHSESQLLDKVSDKDKIAERHGQVVAPSTSRAEKAGTIYRARSFPNYPPPPPPRNVAQYDPSGPEHTFWSLPALPPLPEISLRNSPSLLPDEFPFEPRIVEYHNSAETQGLFAEIQTGHNVRPNSMLSGELRGDIKVPSRQNNASSSSIQGPNVTQLKGILKTPKVRFVEDEKETAADSPTKERTMLSEQFLEGTGPPVFDFPIPAPPSPPPPPPQEGPRPPTLFTKGIEADEYLSETAFHLYTKFLEGLSRFVGMQGEVVRTRLVTQEKRQMLKKSRNHVSRCDQILMDHLRAYFADDNASGVVKLWELYEACQTARDAVGPLEDEYDTAEVNLGAEEHKLSVVYNELEEEFKQFFKLNVGSSQRSAPSKIEYETSSESSSIGKRDPPEGLGSGLLHGAILDQRLEIGAIPVLATPFNQSQSYGARISVIPESSKTNHDQIHRNKSSTTVEEPQKEVLTDLLGLGGVESLVSNEVEARDQLIADILKGVTNYHLLEPYDDELSDIELPEDPNLQECAQILLLNEGTGSRRTLSEYLTHYVSTRDRINRWLLHQLRSSRRQTFALHRLTPNTAGWEDVALMMWADDTSEPHQLYISGSMESESGDTREVHRPLLATLEFDNQLD